MGVASKNVAVMANPNDERALESAATVIAYLNDAGKQVTVSRLLPAPPSPAIHADTDDSNLPETADLIIAVGGDGTMLYAARHAASFSVPLLGINRGRLGFLADISPAEISDSLDEVLAGHYHSETRMLLRADILQDDDLLSSGLALNDIVVKRRETARMLEFRTTVDGHYVNTHGGDGFIVSTPTGSTAYALSCGGPIVQPGMDAIVLAPICPHTLTDRPIVISGDSRTEIQLLQNDGTLGEVSADGELLGDLKAGQILRIVAANERAELIHPPGYDYFSVLRSKLYWGRDTRDRQPPTD
jgi:NAD+ kinase